MPTERSLVPFCSAGGQAERYGLSHNTMLERDVHFSFVRRNDVAKYLFAFLNSGFTAFCFSVQISGSYFSYCNAWEIISNRTSLLIFGYEYISDAKIIPTTETELNSGGKNNVPSYPVSEMEKH